MKTTLKKMYLLEHDDKRAHRNIISSLYSLCAIDNKLTLN